MLYQENISDEEAGRLCALFPRVAEELRIVILGSDIRENVKSAVEAAGSLKAEAGDALVDAVLAILAPDSEADEEMLTRALEVLSDMDPKGEKSKEALLRFLDSEAEDVWTAAAHSLGEMGICSDVVVPKIIKRYDGVEFLQKKLLSALEAYGTQAVQAVELLLRAINEDETAEEAYRALEKVDPERAAKDGVPPHVALARVVSTDLAEKSLNALMRGVPAEELDEVPQVAAHIDTVESAVTQTLVGSFLADGRDFLEAYGDDLPGASTHFIQELADPETIKFGADKLEALASKGYYANANALERLLDALAGADDEDNESACVHAIGAIVDLTQRRRQRMA